MTTRVIHPLFNFQYFDRDDFVFSDQRFSIRHFDDWGTLPDREIFSSQDRDYIKKENKALVADVTDPEGYKVDMSLLLMT